MSSRRSGAASVSKKLLGPPDVPACLPIGTDVSAKFKGAFCEAKIHHYERKLIEIRAHSLKKNEHIPVDHVYTHEDVQGKLEVGSIVQVSYKKMFVEAKITHVKDLCQYKIVFNDGDERVLKRNQMLLKGEKHYDSQSNLDNLPLSNPDALKSRFNAVDDDFIMGASRSATRQLKAIMDVEQKRENQSENMAAWSSLSDLSESSDEDTAKIVEDEGPSTSKSAKKSDLDQGRKKGTRGGRSTSPKNEFNEGIAVVGRAKASDTNKITLCFGVVVAKSVFLAATTERIKSISDNEIPIRCLPRGDYRLFKTTQLTLYDENKLSLDSLSNKMRETGETLLRYKNKGRLPNGWTDESIHGIKQPVKKSRKSKRQSIKNAARRDKFYRQINDYYTKIIDMNVSEANPMTKNGFGVDLCRLFFIVRSEGGYRAVSFSDKWSKIAQKLKWSDHVTGDELREIYHNRLETFEYFLDRMADNKNEKQGILKAPKPTRLHSHASTPPSSTAERERGTRTTPKKSQTPATVERKRKAQSATIPKKRRDSESSPSDLEEQPGTVSSRKESSSSPHLSQKVRAMSPTEFDANDGYVAADIFSQIVETKIIRAAHRTKFYSARVVEARRAPLNVILRVLTKLDPVVGTSNNYKFQNKLHRDALIELGRLTAAFVHYLGWNNRFDEWVELDRIKVSPETKRLSMLTLIRTYSFSPNLLDAIHNFFKRRRITREKYKARRRANNSDEQEEDDKKLGIENINRRKESGQLDGPPAAIKLYPELQTFLYDDEGFKIPTALPEKIEKDEYDEISNAELADAAVFSDIEANNGEDPDNATINQTTGKRGFKRKSAQTAKEAGKKLEVPQKSATSTIVETKREADEIAKKKKKVEEAPPPSKTLTEEIKQPSKSREESKHPKLTTEVKEAPSGKLAPTAFKQTEKPVTRSETPKQPKVDINIHRPIDFTSSIPVDDRAGRTLSRSSPLKSQVSEEILPAIDIPLQSSGSRLKPSQSSTTIQSESGQQHPTSDLPSPTNQRQTPGRRKAAVDRQPSLTETVPSSLTKTTVVAQSKTTQQEIQKEEPVAEFKAFSPITPPPITTEPPEVITLAESPVKSSENRFSPRSRFLQTLSQNPQPSWRSPASKQTDAELAAEFEVHENKTPITIDTLRHVPPALLASHLNIQLTPATVLPSAEKPKPVTTTAHRSPAVFDTPQQIPPNKLAVKQTKAADLPQILSPATTSMKPLENIAQTALTTSTMGSQLALNPQMLAILQAFQQQQALQLFQSTALPQHPTTSQSGSSTSLAQTSQSVQPVQQIPSAKMTQQMTLMNALKQSTVADWEQIPILRSLAEYVILLQYLCVDPLTQEALETLRRTFSLSRYDSLRLIRPQFVNIITRIAQLDTQCSENMDSTMRPMIEQLVSAKIAESIRGSRGLAPMLQRFVHPLYYNQILSLPSPAQAQLSLPQLQLLLGQRQSQQQSQQALRQPATSMPMQTLLSDQIMIQQQAQLAQAQQNTADHIHARIQALLLTMQPRSLSTTDRTHMEHTCISSSNQIHYISPPNDPRPSVSSGQPTQQASTTTGSFTAHSVSGLPRQHDPTIFVPGIYSTNVSGAKLQTVENHQEQAVHVQSASVQMLENSANTTATLNLNIQKQGQTAECNRTWPTSQTTQIVAVLNQKPCEDCGANPSVIEMHLLNKMPFHLRNQILDNYSKAHKMSKERRNRPQCKVKNLSKQAQKQKIERRRNEEMLEELRNNNGADFLLLDKRFCNREAATQPHLLYEIFSSVGYNLFATERLPESGEIKQRTEEAIKSMTPEQIRESVMKCLKENGNGQESVDFNNLEDLNKYIRTLSNVAEQHQVRLGLANHNLEMTEEIAKTVNSLQSTIAKEQQKCEAREESVSTNTSILNRNKPKYLFHRSRKGYY